jgi:hypothetical protein
MYKTLACYIDPIEAHIVCGRLQAEGYTAYVADAHSTLGNWDWRLAIGGAKVRVLSEEFQAARDLMRALDRGEYALTPEEGGSVSLPACRESWSSRVAYLFAFWLGLPLPWRRRHSESP